MLSMFHYLFIKGKSMSKINMYIYGSVFFVFCGLFCSDDQQLYVQMEKSIKQVGDAFQLMQNTFQAIKKQNETCLLEKAMQQITIEDKDLAHQKRCLEIKEFQNQLEVLKQENKQYKDEMCVLQNVVEDTQNDLKTVSQNLIHKKQEMKDMAEELKKIENLKFWKKNFWKRLGCCKRKNNSVIYFKKKNN
jgi:hypothetical protein